MQELHKRQERVAWTVAFALIGLMLFCVFFPGVIGRMYRALMPSPPASPSTMATLDSQRVGKNGKVVESHYSAKVTSQSKAFPPSWFPDF